MAITASPRLKELALDLTSAFPRSPHESLAGYVVAARALDKCRAFLNGTLGEYNYNCPLDKQFFEFAEINPDDFTGFVATGATDEEVVAWIQSHAKARERVESVLWNNRMRSRTPADLPPEIQVMWEEEMPGHLFAGKRPLYRTFDLLDLEEERIPVSASDVYGLSQPSDAKAKDLTREFPRSPRVMLAGYVIAARALDKCRALLNGTVGPYIFNGGMDKQFFEFTGIDADAFRAFVSTGADDVAVADWIV
ncbi:MAG TPA: DUF5069 domain-containing protein, partial [Oculatellaceae cyanobacterium]